MGNSMVSPKQLQELRILQMAWSLRHTRTKARKCCNCKRRPTPNGVRVCMPCWDRYLRTGGTPYQRHMFQHYNGKDLGIKVQNCSYCK